ncbi:MAG: polysaccharide biosynthesis protein, partial [Phycisphaerales bacterium]|nr:polysaccharide biosynthesis protein [Phycisphaerales bacterium]
YFMTIPEAASLVIQAGAIDEAEADGASVFELDMGEPIPILDIALRLVRLSGLRPVLDTSNLSDLPGETRRLLRGPSDGTCVPIRLTGIRPGEKLYEELAYEIEELNPTGCEGILAWSGPEPEASFVQSMIGDLESIREEFSKSAVVSTLVRHVPELASSASPMSSGGVQAA